MNKDVSSSFESHFGMLNDPRIDRSKLYPLSEILFIVLSASICGGGKHVMLNLLESMPTPTTLIPNPSPSREKGADRAN